MRMRDKFACEDYFLIEKLADYLNYKFVFKGYDDFSDVKFQRIDKRHTYKTGEDLEYVYTETVELPHHFRFAGRPHSTLTDSQKADVRNWYKTKYRSLGRKKMIRDRRLFDVRKFLLSLLTGFFGFVFLVVGLLTIKVDKQTSLLGIAIGLPLFAIAVSLFVFVIYKGVMAKKLRKDISFQKKIDDIVAVAPESVVRCYFRPTKNKEGIENMQGDRYTEDDFRD